MVIFGVFSFWLGLKLANQIETRSPAAIPKNYDFSNLVGEELKIAATDRLMRGAKIISAGDLKGVQFGHFQLKNAQRIVMGACDIYNRIELVFKAGDMAVSGEAPEMIISGPCETTDNGDEIMPFMINYKSVLHLAVQDRELQSVEDSPITVRFRNVSDSWPKIWVLSALKLTASSSDYIIQIENADIKRVLSKNIVIEWP